MALFEVDTGKCHRDGACATVCPAGIIRIEEGGLPAPTERAGDFCISCGHCVAVCPTGALSHRDMPPEQCEPVAEDRLPDEAAFRHALRARRSIRAYREQPVPRDDLARLIEGARHAPSGHNAQPVRWLVFLEASEVRRLAGLTVDWMRSVLRDQPAFAESLNMDHVVSAWEKGRDRVCRDAPHVIVAHAHKEDRTAPAACTVALAHLELTAFSMGLGACWAGFLNAAASLWPPMMESLGLPEGHASFGAMLIGRPRFRYRRIPLRREARITWR